MGNVNSANVNDLKQEFKSIDDIIDYIATHYILTSDFESLKKLTEKAYCDKLVIITSDIFNDYFTEKDVEYLTQRIQKGEEINKMNDRKLLYFNSDKINELDSSQDKNKSINKKRQCIGIAKFYIKIAHVFAAIVMTVNPDFSFNDSIKQPANNQDQLNLLRENVQINIEEQKTMNGNVDNIVDQEKINITGPKSKTVKKSRKEKTLCEKRIDALNFVENDTNSEFVKLKSDVCNMNSNAALTDENGITELIKLYYDVYDYSKGEFTKMSDKSKEQYNNDLKLFYKVFTGKDDMPETIMNFKDIQLSDFSNKASCIRSSKSLEISKNNLLFKEYADNLRQMMANMTNNQNKLLIIINNIFQFVHKPYSNDKQIRIQPSLTDKKLDQLIKECRSLIINLYLTCEKDFLNGMKIYEAIVNMLSMQTAGKQIINIENDKKKLIQDIKEQTVDLDPLNKSNPPNFK